MNRGPAVRRNTSESAAIDTPAAASSRRCAANCRSLSSGPSSTTGAFGGVVTAFKQQQYTAKAFAIGLVLHVLVAVTLFQVIGRLGVPLSTVLAFWGVAYFLLRKSAELLNKPIRDVLPWGGMLSRFIVAAVPGIILFAVSLVVLSLCGGAICRIAALQFAQGEKPGLTEAVHFAVRKFHSLVTAPVTPLAIIAVIGVFILLLGFIGNIPFLGELLVGLFLPLALLAAALIAIIAIGTLAGFNLMLPAIAYEDSDCFDAISRSFSYVYAKPWHMGWYTLAATVYGTICYAFVRFFCHLLIQITRLFLQAGFLRDNEKLDQIWPAPEFKDFLVPADPAPANWSTSAGAFLVDLWVIVVVGLMVSYVISFYFSANTIIYALMRKRVDKTALDEVYTGADEMAADSMLATPQPEAQAGPADAPQPDQYPETSE